MKKVYLNMISLVLLMWIGVTAAAQQKDSLSQMKLFIDVMSATSKIPLDLSMTMQYSSNLVTQESDTLSMKGEAYLRSNRSYVRLGEQEQVIEQSLALLVSDSLQRMIVYEDGAAIFRRMQGFAGLLRMDSSVKKMTSEFSIRALPGQLALDNRKFVPGTAYPALSYVLHYDDASKKPHEIQMIQRSLVELDLPQYEALQKEPSYTGMLFTVNGQFYAVKEKKMLVEYTKLEQPVADNIPVSVSDRIWLGPDGVYKGVRQYEEYKVVMASK